MLNIDEKNISNFLINKSIKKKIIVSLINKYFNNLSISLDELKKRCKIKNINKILYGKKEANFNELKKIADSFNLNLKDLMPVENSNKVVIVKAAYTKKWNFPSNEKKYFFLRELASIKDVPSAKSIEINVLINNNHKFKISSHQYIYVLSKKGSIVVNNKVLNLKNRETLYLKPFVTHSFPKKYESFLVLRVEGKISGDVQMQI